MRWRGGFQGGFTRQPVTKRNEALQFQPESPESKLQSSRMFQIFSERRRTKLLIPVALNPDPTARAMDPMTSSPVRPYSRTALPMSRDPDPSAVPVGPESSDPHMGRTGGYPHNDLMLGSGWFGTDYHFTGGRGSHSFPNDDAFCITAGGEERANTN
jgi:hypothetical protein